MIRATAPDRRRAFWVPGKPLPTFRVRSASTPGAGQFVVLQLDGSLRCSCIAAGYRVECAHVRIARASIEWRTGVRWTPDGWVRRPRWPIRDGRPLLLSVVSEGRAA